MPGVREVKRASRPSLSPPSMRWHDRRKIPHDAGECVRAASTLFHQQPDEARTRISNAVLGEVGVPLSFQHASLTLPFPTPALHTPGTSDRASLRRVCASSSSAPPRLRPSTSYIYLCTACALLVHSAALVIALYGRKVAGPVGFDKPSRNAKSASCTADQPALAPFVRLPENPHELLS